MTWHQSMGHRGPILRPRCIDTERAQTHLLLMLIGYLDGLSFSGLVWTFELLPSKHT